MKPETLFRFSLKRIVVLIGGMTLLLVTSCGESEATEPTIQDPATMHFPDVEGLFNYFQQLYASRQFEALADTLSAANKDLRSSALSIQAAYGYWEAGMEQQAAEQLHLAIDQGMSDPNVLDKFVRPGRVPEGGVWVSLQSRLDSIQELLGNIEHFEFRTEAMDAFWPHFNQAVADTAKARLALKSFIAEGPQELRDYYVIRYGSIDNMFGQMINGAPDYYQYLEGQFQADSLAPIRGEILDAMSRFKEYYPDAVFPKVFVVPGILNSGGTATEMGMFLGGDMYGKSPEMPVKSLNDWQRESIMDFTSLPGLTIHELMHFQQHYRDRTNQETLLSAAIQEGVCDFLAELCLGSAHENENLTFMADPSNSAWIFGEFKEEMMGDDNSKWLYNGGSIEDRPADLGYTLGYLITKSYFEQQDNKQDAVNELLTTDDFRKIVAGSAYADILGTDEDILP